MDPNASGNNDGARAKVLLVLAVLLLAVGGSVYAYWNLYAKFYINTDDAYVAGVIADIEPQIAGSVKSISADNTDAVLKGQTLVKLDDTDAIIALEKAKVELATSVNMVKSYLDRVETARANVAFRKAELEKSQMDYNRRKNLFQGKVVTEEILEHAAIDLRASQKSVEQAEHQLSETRVIAGSGDVANHTSVRMAKEKLRDAWMALKRTVIVAPLSGKIAKRSVEVGERVTPGKPLMAIIPLNLVWVDANFKENQLVDMRINQPVTITSDLYGHDVVFHGKVEGIGAGTGGVFSVIPPQNATGNWIKIVQRVPVKISLNGDEVAKSPLLIGLSVRVTVDAHDKSGQAISAAKPARELYKTDVYDLDEKGADELMQQIIRQNLPGQKAEK